MNTALAIPGSAATFLTHFLVAVSRTTAMSSRNSGQWPTATPVAAPTKHPRRAAVRSSSPPRSRHEPHRLQGPRRSGGAVPPFLSAQPTTPPPMSAFARAAAPPLALRTMSRTRRDSIGAAGGFVSRRASFRRRCSTAAVVAVVTRVHRVGKWGWRSRSVSGDPRGLAADITNLGLWGNGDVQVELDNERQIPYAMELVRQAFAGKQPGTRPVLMTRWGRVVSSGAPSNDTSHPGMDGGDFGKRHRRGRRPGRAGPRPCVALERAGKVAPGRAVARASRAPHQVRPSLPLFSFPSASDSGDAGSCIAGSPADAPAASSRSGSTSGGAPDEPSSPAAAKAEAASDQRLPRDTYLPCFRPFRNSSRIEGSLISRSASVAARPSISCTVEPGWSRKACSTKRGTEPLGARLLPPARRFAAAPGLPRLAPVGVARFPPAPRISSNSFLASDWPRA